MHFSWDSKIPCSSRRDALLCMQSHVGAELAKPYLVQGIEKHLGTVTPHWWGKGDSRIVKGLAILLGYVYNWQIALLRSTFPGAHADTGGDVSTT